MEKIRLGISACLLGENVRYDGGHKLDRFLTDTLGQFVEYVPVCPEVECGLPVPREAMRLEGDPNSPRLMTIGTKQDMTDRMVQWAQKRVIDLEKENLCGFIFKSDSPSSGMERVNVYKEKGIPAKKGIGMFARIFMDLIFMETNTTPLQNLNQNLMQPEKAKNLFLLKRHFTMMKKLTSKSCKPARPCK